MEMKSNKSERNEQFFEKPDMQMEKPLPGFLSI